VVLPKLDMVIAHRTEPNRGREVSLSELRELIALLTASK
jgi:hypothetical protein